MRFNRSALTTALGLLAAISMLGGCSKGARGGNGGTAGTDPSLAAAARARLDAESRGWAAGDPAQASSLSIGDAASADQAYARSLAGQINSGDTTDYTFETLSVAAYPLDGGTTDFIAFETERGHSAGGVFRVVELYHRDSPAGPWKAQMSTYFNDNIDLPQLKLQGKGGHLLTAAEMQSQSAVPSDIATRYCAALNDGSASGRLPPGTFLSSAATTGAVESATHFLSSIKSHGTASLHWAPRPGGEAVTLTNGVLVFASVQQSKTEHWNVEGTKTFFTIQDPKRLDFGGQLAPGNYQDVSQTLLTTVAVVVGAHGPPDVVAQATTTIAVMGSLARS